MTPSDSPRPPSATDLADLISRARAADGYAPFSDAALAELAAGSRRVVWAGPAVAIASDTEAEFVVDPAHRREKNGGRMLNLLLTATPGDLLLSVPGAHPDALALAASRGLEAVGPGLYRWRSEPYDYR